VNATRRSEKLGPGHKLENFDCGSPELNRSRGSRRLHFGQGRREGLRNSAGAELAMRVSRPRQAMQEWPPRAQRRHGAPGSPCRCEHKRGARRSRAGAPSIVDRARIGLWGGSYGGYLTALEVVS